MLLDVRMRMFAVSVGEMGDSDGVLDSPEQRLMGSRSHIALRP